VVTLADRETSLVNAGTLALATYRLTRLVIDDKITEGPREWIFAKFGDPSVSKISYLFSCPHCVSVYTGLAVSLGDTVFPRTTRVLTRALAFSAVTGMIAEREAT
jgi:hypothetical protein